MWYLYTLYVAFPAFIANIMPVVAARYHLLPATNHSISQKYLGANKTWRGFVVGILSATTAAFLQFFIYIPYIRAVWQALLFGALAGFGALFGDAVKSFFKRALKIAPGKPFIPFDYIDYIIGMTIFTYPLYPWTTGQIIFLLLFVCIANPVSNGIGYISGLKKTYW